jgi:hypothetical protein
LSGLQGVDDEVLPNFIVLGQRIASTSDLRFTLTPDDFKTVLAVKGSLRRAATRP